MKKFRAYQWGFNTLRKNGYRGNITPLESLRNEHNKNYATLPKEIMDFPSCILDKKFNQFIKGGNHVGLVTILVLKKGSIIKYHNGKVKEFLNFILERYEKEMVLKRWGVISSLRLLNFLE